ncbi:MAG: hypothetical protein ACP5MX_01560 [Candidatus Micrarchaeia archaeon]
MDIADLISNNYKIAFDAILHPGTSTKKAMSIGDAIKFYYSIAIIPLVLGIIISIAIGTHVSKLMPFGAVAGLAMAALLFAMYAVIMPIGIVIDSGVYHIVIKRLFNMYNKDYRAVFSAFTYAMIPAILFYWLIMIPVLGFVVLLLMGVWSFIIEIIALANLLSMSRLKALGTIILEGIVVGIIVFIIALVVGGVMAALLLHGSASSNVFPAFQNSSAIVPSGYATSANYSSCNNFTIVDSTFGSNQSGVCNWNGGTLNVSIAGGNSGYATVSITGSNGKLYYYKGTDSRCITSSGSFYAPAQQYIVKIYTGNGGGACGPSIIHLS